MDDGSEAVIIDPVLDFDLSSACTSTSNVDKVGLRVLPFLLLLLVFCVQIVAHVKARNVKVRWVLETHVHADHITGAQILRQHFPDVKLAIGAGVRKVQKTFQPIFNLPELKCDGSQFDRLFEEGETLQVGAIKLNVLFTPGMLEPTGAR